jgi:hypothetical protein
MGDDRLPVRDNEIRVGEADFQPKTVLSRPERILSASPAILSGLETMKSVPETIVSRQS